MNDDYLIELAEEIENYIKDHDDSIHLDLTDLDISVDIIKGIVDKLEKGLFRDMEQTNDCNTCLHFKSGKTDWEDECAHGWDCIHYHNKPNRWEAIK